jgi:uncharacterized phage-associated protein
MLDPRAVANAFVDRSPFLTATRAAPLVFLAHGWHLALRGLPLVDAAFMTTADGPCPAELLPKPLSGTICRGGYMCHPDTGIRISQALDRDAARVIDGTWLRYGRQSAEELQRATVDGTPWDHACASGTATWICNEIVRGHIIRLAIAGEDAPRNLIPEI